MIDCRVWNGSNNDDFVYPELDEGVDPYLAGKQNFGIALSGGGMRSVTLSLGWLRGLHEIKVLEKARYVSSNSGSSWCNGPLGYLSNEQGIGPYNEFFGKYLSPEECTIEKATSFHPRSHAAVISKSNFTGSLVQDVALKIGDLPSNLFEQTSSDKCCSKPLTVQGLSRSNKTDLQTKAVRSDFWSQSVGKIFFDSYGLNAKSINPSQINFNSMRSGNNSGSDNVRSYEVLKTNYYCKSKKVINNGDQESGIELAEIEYGSESKNDFNSSISATSNRYYPFPIINASVEILPTTKEHSSSISNSKISDINKIKIDSEVNRMMYLPVEFTPLYYGIPPRHNIQCCSSLGTASIGGILFEPVAFTANPSEELAIQISKNIESAIFIESLGVQEGNMRRRNGHKEDNEDLTVSISKDNDGWVIVHKTSRKSSPTSIKIPHPERVITIYDQAGIGSRYLAERYGSNIPDTVYKLFDFPLYNYWDPLSGSRTQLRYMDGGASDDTGILSLLRRGVSKIISFCANNEELQDQDLSPHRDTISVNGEEEEGVREQWDRSVDANQTSIGCLAGLFGRMKSKIGSVDGVPDAQYNLYRKVFESNAWDDLIAGLRRKAFPSADIAEDTIGSPSAQCDTTKMVNDKTNQETNKGKYQRITNNRPNKSVSFLLRTNVLPNPAICIKGNHAVEILFIINSYSAEWESLLPAETQQIMSDDASLSPPEQRLSEVNSEPTDLWNFPYIPVSRLKYSPLLVGLLSQQATWNVLQNKSEIEDLLS